MLCIEDHVLDQPTVDAVTSDSAVIKSARDFLAQPAQVVDTSNTNTIHVFQGECALVDGTAGVRVLGSTDATTCVVALLACAKTKLVSIAHHDEHTAFNPVNIQRTIQGMERPMLYMVGGYNDCKGIGHRVCTLLLDALHKHTPVPICIKLACMHTLNTEATGGPCCQGLVFDTASFTAFPTCSTAWQQAARGPLIEARMAQLWYGSSRTLSSVQYAADQLCLELMQGKLPASYIDYLVELTQLSDEELLQRVSTSPEHELPCVAAEIRASHEWLIKQEGPITRRRYVCSWVANKGWQAEDADPNQQPRPDTTAG